MRQIQLLTKLIPQVNWHGNFYYRYIYALGLYLGVYFYAKRWWAEEAMRM